MLSTLCSILTVKNGGQKRKMIFTSMLGAILVVTNTVLVLCNTRVDSQTLISVTILLPFYFLFPYEKIFCTVQLILSVHISWLMRHWYSKYFVNLFLKDVSLKKYIKTLLKQKSSMYLLFLIFFIRALLHICEFPPCKT